MVLRQRRNKCAGTNLALLQTGFVRLMRKTDEACIKAIMLERIRLLRGGVVEEVNAGVRVRAAKFSDDVWHIRMKQAPHIADVELMDLGISARLCRANGLCAVIQQ